MDALRSLKLASICLVVGLLCWLVVTAASERTILFNVICLLPATYVWPVAAGAGTLAGLWSVLIVVLWFERANRAELLLVACTIVALGNGALLLLAMWWWFGRRATR